MKQRYLVLGFSVLLALSVAVPAFGGASDPTATTSASAKKIAKKALKKAKKANKRSKKALNVANNALDVANQALEQGGAPGPGGPEGPAGPAGAASVAGSDVVTIANGAGDFADPNDPPASQLIALNEGFAWALACGDAPADPTTALVVRNVSGGNDSHITPVQTPPPGGVDDFDEDETAVVVLRTGANQSGTNPDWTLIYGTEGDTTQAGFGGVLNNPNGFGGADCVGSLNLLAL
jgi:hypothetical protein